MRARNVTYRPRPGSLPKGAVARPEDFDYGIGREPWGSGGITVTSAPRPERFAWGRILRVHVVGEPYAIVEYVPRRAANVSAEDFDPAPLFAVFVGGARGSRSDTSHSYRSLDRALIAAIAWRAEQRTRGTNRAANSQASHYIAEMLQLEER